MSTAAKAEIREQALSLGFDAVGFAPAELGAEVKWRLADYLAKGRHGDMGWMSDTFERRHHPRALWPAARSVVVLGLDYGTASDPLANLAHPDRGNISIYARNRDYHDTVKKRLKALARWMHEHYGEEVKVFVDTAPVMEKPLAQAAGLGWQGKHSNLLSRQHGNWFFLGEVFTTLELEPDAAERSHCGSCTACLEICPTRAFPAPYQVDARRCISYLTIEHKGPIARELRSLMGNRIYGCDDCLAVCPWNKFAQVAHEPDFLPRIELTAPRLADLLELDDQKFRALFTASPVKRIGVYRFLRNVLIAAGNSGDPTLLPKVRARLDDPNPLVRGAAVWALRQLADDTEVEAQRRERLPAETDLTVVEEWTA
ncbi:MAG TPA: tRNA epoxyqueuosine(34) reductase QueG [Kiloniellales bacterium]|jgi:epoxyqueuosine reductase|nr:tRNA epoxyqueuosine(34) reductase QueG [Kiloniellales bacterium]